MIGLPNLPTDNLYKFLAVAGIVLLVTGLVGPFILDQQEIEWSWRTLQEIEDRLDEKKLKVADVIARENLAQAAKEAAMQEAAKGLGDSRDNALLKFAARVKERDTMRIWRNTWLSFTMWLGATCAIAGFFLWWWNVQRLQDAILKLERIKIEQEVQLQSKQAPPE